MKIAEINISWIYVQAVFISHQSYLNCSFSRTATRVSTVATVARMEAGDHSDVLVCASEYIADRLYFVTLKGHSYSHMMSERLLGYL